MMTVDEAVKKLRAAPETRQFMLDSYLGEDTLAAARQFAQSEEFREVQELLGGVKGKAVLDLGAGTGIGTYAFCEAGCAKVFAVDPDASDVVGRGLMARIVADMPVEIKAGVGEALPLPDGCVDVVYCRQVLHHTQDVAMVMRECYRVLRPKGRLLACREHVVDGPEQLREFLANHRVHQLAGGENAYSLEVYAGAVRGAGFENVRLIKPWDSIICAYPAVRTRRELQEYPRKLLRDRLGWLGGLVAGLPGMRGYTLARLNRRPVAGRLYAFYGEKG